MMKLKLLLSLLLIAGSVLAQKKHVLRPDAQGYLIVRGTYKPGDTLQLDGYIRSVEFNGLSGTAQLPIIITNVPGKTVTLGDSLWAGGSWGHGPIFKNCHHIDLYGTSKGAMKIIGSNTTALDGNGYPMKTAYFNLVITEFSDNFKVHDITIRHGGVGVLCKTDPNSNSKTWFPNTYLDNFEFYNLDISNTYNEAMYIGHTATYWNISNNTPVYSGTINTATMKQPIKLRNVKIHNNNIHDIHNDAIQTAAVDDLMVYGNIVTNWAIKKDWSHNGGILIGGRVKNFHVYENKVLNGWGEFLQIYAEQGISIVENNLFVSNKLSGVGLRGGSGLLVKFLNNTIVSSGEAAFRINGTSGGTAKNLLHKNIIAGYVGRAVYTENGGTYEDSDNKIYATVALSGLSDKTNYVATNGYGYSASVVIPDPPKPEPPAPVKITISSNELAALLKALKAGTYTLEIGVDSTIKKVSITVQ